MKLFGIVALSIFAALVLTLVFTMGLGVEPDGGVLALALLLGVVLTLTVRADTTLLDTLRTAGIDIASDCCEGLCGSCEVGVIDGAIDHRDRVLTKAERTDNERMMACCSRSADGGKITLAL